MELVDILDKQGNKTGRTTKRGNSLKQGEYYLIVDVWLFRQDINIDEVVLEPSEVDDILWATHDIIKQLIDNDEFLSSPRLPYLQELFQICQQ